MGLRGSTLPVRPRRQIGLANFATNFVPSIVHFKEAETMITPIVQFDLPADVDRQQASEIFSKDCAALSGDGALNPQIFWLQ